jgi:hypothetical protein
MELRADGLCIRLTSTLYGSKNATGLKAPNKVPQLVTQSVKLSKAHYMTANP